MSACHVIIGQRRIDASTHAVILPDAPTPSERHAARELREHLALLLGARLPIARESARDPRRIPLWVGRCAGLPPPAVDFQGLGPDGYEIRTNGPALILAGNQRGVLYAVYTFLEDYCHCRWFTPDCRVIPKAGVFKVPSLRRRYMPPLMYRDIDYPHTRDADWAARQKLNGRHAPLGEAHGGRVEYCGWVHTFQELVPPARYFRRHPEYFSEINGRRAGPNITQLCLTNPAVLRLAIAAVRRRMRMTPQAQYFSVSQNDGGSYCECARCRALAEREGSQAGPILHFVNAIADAVRREFPDKFIDTLAYSYSRKPPRYVRPHPNVVIRLCSIECCFAHPIAKDAYSRTFRQDLRQWARICDRVFIWDYVINFAHSIMPFPNLQVLQPNIVFFVQNHVKGVYEESNYYSRGGELAELRAYLIAKSLWNPRSDVKKDLAEFLAGYYQKAAEPIRAYIELLQRRVAAQPGRHLPIYAPPTLGYWMPALLRRAAILFDAAERLAANEPEVLRRVRIARLPLMYAQMWPGLYAERRDRLIAPPGVPRRPLVKRFAAIARQAGVTHVGELRTLKDWLAQRRDPTQACLRLVYLRNRFLVIGVLPEKGGRIWRCRYRSTGQDVFKQYNAAAGVIRPDEGGYDEFSQSAWRSPGWCEPYRVVAHARDAVTLQATLVNGLQCNRRIQLVAGAPGMIITTTLTNCGSKPVTAGLRPRAVLALADWRQAVIGCQRPDGSWSAHALAPRVTDQSSADTGQYTFKQKEMPDGAWRLVDRRTGLTVVHRFDRSAVEQCSCFWHGPEQRILMELFLKEEILAPGAARQFTQTYELTRALPAAQKN